MGGFTNMRESAEWGLVSINRKNGLILGYHHKAENDCLNEEIALSSTE